MKRLLLDTNLWRYLIDHDAFDEFCRCSRKFLIVVPPAVVYETLRMQDETVRDAVLHALTDHRWKRLMPEAYSEAEELKQEMRRLRPGWLRSDPDLRLYKRHRYDWLRKEGGFWSRARSETSKESARVRMLGDADLAAARAEAYQAREFALEQSRKAPSNIRIDNWRAQPSWALPGWDGEDVDCWRLASIFPVERVFFALIHGDTSHPYTEWLGAEVDFAAVTADQVSFNRFWLYEAKETVLRRFWIRSAFELMQRWHKVTDGTPADSQLAAYLVEADIVLSADRNFIRFAELSRAAAPFPMATAHVMPAGERGVKELLAFMGRIGKTEKIGR